METFLKILSSIIDIINKSNILPFLGKSLPFIIAFLSQNYYILILIILIIGILYVIKYVIKNTKKVEKNKNVYFFEYSDDDTIYRVYADNNNTPNYCIINRTCKTCYSPIPEHELCSCKNSNIIFCGQNNDEAVIKKIQTEIRKIIYTGKSDILKIVYK